jgi:nitroreductase
MNKTLSDLMTRRSVRKFDSRAVSRADLETIIEAGLSAPSAHNQQPWHIAVLDDKKIRSRITEAMRWFQPVENAPVALLILGDPTVCVQKEYWNIDCAALSENILIAARALDLGACWCGIAPIESNDIAFRSALDIPEPLVPFGMIAIGYPEAKDAFHERAKDASKGRISWNPDWGRKA